MAAPGEETFLFLCPQGHRLQGPTRLSGKIGRCPHCQSRFEIPFPHEGQDDEYGDRLDNTLTEDLLQDYSATSGDAVASQGLITEIGFQDWPDALSADRSVVHLGMGPSDRGQIPVQSSHTNVTAVPPPLPTMPILQDKHSFVQHPLSQLVARLWAEREHGGIVELHLAGGTLLAPEWFDEPGSRGGYGLFASQAADGTVTMTVVPWDEVKRVVVRGIVGLPDGMFE
jgi:hypothetical protein